MKVIVFIYNYLHLIRIVINPDSNNGYKTKRCNSDPQRKRSRVQDTMPPSEAPICQKKKKKCRCIIYLFPAFSSRRPVHCNFVLFLAVCFPVCLATKATCPPLLQTYYFSVPVSSIRIDLFTKCHCIWFLCHRYHLLD